MKYKTKVKYIGDFDEIKKGAIFEIIGFTYYDAICQVHILIHRDYLKSQCPDIKTTDETGKVTLTIEYDFIKNFCEEIKDEEPSLPGEESRQQHYDVYKPNVWGGIEVDNNPYKGMKTRAEIEEEIRKWEIEVDRYSTATGGNAHLVALFGWKIDGLQWVLGESDKE